ncbi:hypothetical protein FD04_GL000721 [Secundilactobacillus odoratitofui DSM 19909 = JCM 15043]|uniref:Polyprenyl synthetase n=1 Tax=Secundilactobacillus odoratitofui DSM 19909 = JCM 15043 TaxID=1423776 RepID=A0A0R1M1A9_9LACO|nr:hypothetical protein [Secundilactobacillus odoratitofui]KRK97751.1 hypothetical protein FD04_GL000721 [Secundilactobacillus odoratitofui DSM 19909 = JCM 15043]
MGFDPDNYVADVALEDDFQAMCQQLPDSVREPISNLALDNDRRFRQALWTIFQQTAQQPLSNAANFAQSTELLALASALIPATFKPSRVTPSDIAMSKAQSYDAQYLYGQFVINIAGSSIQAEERQNLLDDAQNFWLSHSTRLQLNFNQRERVADYLKDAKVRDGALTSITSRLAAISGGMTDRAIIDLIATIGETLGVIARILTDINQTHDSLDFRTRLLMGDYPLSLLFGFEEESEWFTHFFGAQEKPTSDAFYTARKLTIQAGEKSAASLAGELISQTRLDANALPEGAIKASLMGMLQQLADDSQI